MRSPRSGQGPHEVGAVLVAVLGVTAVLAVAAGAVATRTVATVRAADAAVAREEALHLAETTAAFVLDRLAADVVGWSTPGGPDPSPLGHGWRDPAAALLGAPLPAAAGGDAVRADLTRIGTGPTVAVRVGARVRGAVRTVRVEARPATVADVAWATVHAVRDPLTTGGDAACARHRWTVGIDADPNADPGPDAVAPDRPAEPEVASPADPCVRTRITAALEVVGPMHLDDAPRIDRARSAGGRITTAATRPDGRARVDVRTAEDVDASTGRDAVGVGPALLLPEDPFAALGAVPTCTLRGPTLIRFDGGAVRVRSPRSHPRHDADGGPPVECPWLDPATLDGVVGTLLPDPVAIAVRADPGARCATHPLGIDPGEDTVVEQTCRDGTAHVWGTYRGAITVAAEHDVQVVWDVVPEVGSGHDGSRLGLVAGRSVVVRRPVGPPIRLVAPFGTDAAFAGPGIAPFGAHPLDAPTDAPVRWEEPRIVAVVVALGGSLRVQNPSAGRWSDVPVVVRGAVAQRFDGPMGDERRDATGALQVRTGRPLRVVHDAGLETDLPPGLPRIHGGALRVLRWEEVLSAGSGAGP